ncbi:MFHAS1 [Branchiostoma lanceolatum]|uniref:non-specific serine/threonine protein kinase n=1 Tax=Branchiostoma lanceolatum TaxID=7740 RepID=A0A8J9W0R3_BRALA|nr:MFHAS1 [Branchiostoma lanceolatum]
MSKKKGKAKKAPAAGGKKKGLTEADMLFAQNEIQSLTKNTDDFDVQRHLLSEASPQRDSQRLAPQRVSSMAPQRVSSMAPQKRRQIPPPPPPGDFATSISLARPQSAPPEPDPVDMSWKELFTDLDVKTYYPLEAFKAKIQYVDACLGHVDFGGIDQLTDGTFRVLYSAISQFAGKLQAVDCVGCTHLTDAGVYWLARCGQVGGGLKKVNLKGCRQLTEASILHLMEFNPGLGLLDMGFTSVSSLSVFMEEKCKPTGFLNVDFTGCPLVTPPASQAKSLESFQDILSFFKDTANENLVYKAPRYRVVIVGDHTPASAQLLVSLLPKVSQLSNPPLPGQIEVYQDCVLQQGGRKRRLEIIYCSPDELNSSLFVNEGTIFVVISNGRSTCTRGADIIKGIWAKVPRAPCLLAELSGEDEKAAAFDMTSAVDLARGSVHTMEGSIAGMDFNGQCNFGKSSQQMVDMKQAIKVISVNESQGAEKLLAEIQEMIETASKLWPQFKNQSTEFHDFVNHLKSVALNQKILPLETLVTKLPKKWLGDGTLAYGKALEALHTMGQVFYLPMLKDQPIILDVKWFLKSVKELSTSKLLVPIGHNLDGFAPDVPVLPKSALSTLTHLTGNSLSLATRVLTDLGICICPYNLPGVSTDAMLVPYANIPATPAVPLDQFWPARASPDDLEMIQHYHILPAPPTGLMTSLLSEFSQLGGFSLVWREGVILQRGAVEVLIQMEKKDVHAGIPVMEAEKKLDPTIKQKAVKAEEAVQKGVLLSFAPKDLRRVQNIATELPSKGYVVTMDGNNSVMDTVSMAAVALMCITNDYKETGRCKRVAQQAAELGVPLIPIKLQADVVLDDWLGIVSNKVLINMTPNQDWGWAMETLTSELGHLGKKVAKPRANLAQPKKLKDTQDLGGPYLTVAARTFKPQPGMDISWVQQIYHSCLTVVEYVLRTQGLSAVVTIPCPKCLADEKKTVHEFQRDMLTSIKQVDCPNCGLQKSADILNGDPEPVFLSNHMWPSKPSEVPRVPGVIEGNKDLCVHCGVTREGAAKLWLMQSIITPTFGHECQLHPTRRPDKQLQEEDKHGSLFHPSHKMEVISAQILDPEGFRDFEVIPADGADDLNLNFGVRSAKGKISMTVEGTKISISTSDSPNGTTYQMDSSAAVYGMKVENADQFDPSEEESPEADESEEPVQQQEAVEMPVNDWQATMRLESKDKKNPSMICVSTVMNVQPPSAEHRKTRVHIHFDGWTNSFDYWTDVDDPDLHPLGYCKANRITLQKPHGYPKPFDWEKYLKEEDVDPVPFILFDETQKKSTKPYLYDPDEGLSIFDSEEEQQKAIAGILQSGSQLSTRKCKVILTRNGQTLSSAVTEGEIRVFLSFGDSPQGRGEVNTSSKSPSGSWLDKEQQLILTSQTMHSGGSAVSVQHLFSSAPFQIGMRLEADDPLGSGEARSHLVCVSNVKDMVTEADGRQKIEVHFDGWTNKYNYWCYTDDIKIHPIGYCAFKGINLQKPKGYSGTFEWNRYLDEIDKEPVPYRRFNSEQTKGSPPYGMGTASKSGSKANATSTKIIACMDYGKLVPQTSDVCKFVEAYQSKILSPRLLPENPTFAVLLPEQLDLPLLLYPSRRAVQGGQGQALHVLCPGELQYQNVHLVGTANAVTLGQQSGRVQGMLSKLLLFCHSLITCRKIFLPPDLAALVKGGVTEDLVKRALARLLSMYASANLLASYLQGSDIHRITTDIDKWLPQEMSTIKDTVLAGKSVSGTNGQWLCPGHQSAWHINDSSLQAFPQQEFGSYASTISTLTFEANGIQSLPDNFFTSFLSLRQANLSSNQLQSLPLGIGSCENLESLSVNHNSITNLPSDFHNCGSNLLVLKISGNPMDSLPSPLANFGQLEELQAASMQLRYLPDDIQDLKKLKILNVSSNPLRELPASFCELKTLIYLDISGVPWIEQEQGKATLLSYEAFLNFTRKHGIFSSVSEKDLRDVFTSCDNDKNGLLDEGEVPKLNAQLFIMFPRFGAESAADDDLGGMPEQIFALESLEELHMKYQAIHRVPAEVKRLQTLKQLSLQHNPKLETLAAELGGLQLKGLQISNCPTLRTPPREIVARGFSAVMAYLARLLSGSVECKRTKLMFVGLGGAGKTSLMRALMSGNYVTPATVGEAITDGIDIKTWEIKQGGSKLSFSVWDFAGQTVYYNTHQFFLSNRAVYMLIWNTRLGHEHAGLDFWLSSIECHAPKAPIFVIGTHADQVTKSELPMEELSRRYHQIKGYFCVSSHTGQGVKELHDKLISVTLDEPYMGERIPQVWLRFEQAVIKDRKKQSVLPWEVVAKHASGAGIFDRSELNQAVQFLHDLGTLQHFDNEYLKDRVVINPQWIVDVMACVVSVHTTAIKEGRFAHKDVSLVWQDYPADLHNWLLRLTEEFDLTFPLPDQPVNVVPCLLPDKEPQYDWPEVEPPCHETKMLYRFDYLPAGLFNRAQVRLCQYSDSSAVWKRGSLLRKNKHLALIQQTRGSELLVRVQGPRPENILFLVHEVFEALIAESFHGVQYDFLIPCPDCIKVGSLDPYMFAASLVRKAVELKAPFLQCGTYFHIVSITELQAIMPPTSGTDFHMHLENAVRDLQNLHVTLSTDVFITFCQDNVPTDYNDPRAVHPARIRDDIQAAGYTCWYQEDQNDLDVQDLAVAMKDAQVTVVLMSDEYEGSESCRAIVHYVRSTLRKPVILIVVGKGWNWQKTDTGLLLAHMLYINMQDCKLYKDKIAEVLSQLEMKTTKKQTQQFPPCFISYCWANSEEACKMGQVTRHPGAVGRVDPRQLKSHLEQKDVKCWMDIERVGKGGLFEDIAEGLRHAKMVVACVSDEYVRSKNCQMEFRFAAVTLRLPIVLAVVGTGFQWESSECGMLSLGFNKINFQHGGEVEMDKLVEFVQEKCKTEEEATNDNAAEDDKSRNSASFQELYELAQRKFLRQVAHYEELLDLPPYPRLVVVDFHQHQDEENEESEEGKGGDAADEVKEVEKEVKMEDDTKEVSESRPTSSMERPRTAGIRTMSKDMMPVTPMFYFRVLCEHEQGWHLCSAVGVPVPGSQAELQSKLKTWSPYLARLYAILKHGPVQLDVLTEEEKGDQFLQFLEENVGSSLDFNLPYGELIKAAIAADTEGTAGGLARCHLPNGKTVWLCEQHRHNGRLTILDSEVAAPAAGGGEQSQVDANMLEQLQNLNINDVPTPKKQPQKQPSQDQPPKQQTSPAKDTATNQEPKKQKSVEEGAQADAEVPRRPKTAKERFRSVVNSVSGANTQSKACSLM